MQKRIDQITTLAMLLAPTLRKFNTLDGQIFETRTLSMGSCGLKNTLHQSTTKLQLNHMVVLLINIQYHNVPPQASLNNMAS